MTRKHLSRRTVLRGAGAAIALPLLDGMVPALTAMRRTAAQPVTRLGIVYLPNGMNMAMWTPKTEGADYQLTPVLQPLEAFRQQMLVVSGLSSTEADSRVGEGGGDHSRAQAAFLTGAHAKKTQGGDFSVGVSMDQLAARSIGAATQLSSLELALEASDIIGGCESGLSCAYIATVSWANDTTPLPMEPDPRAVFERLFGTTGSTDARVRLGRMAKDRSILDSISDDFTRLQRSLGAGDRGKLGGYLEAVRDVERRIQKAEQQSGRELPLVEQPAGAPDSFEEYGKVMFDLNFLAFQSDLTRISTFMVGRELTGRTYPEIGVPDPHHPVSHHGDQPALLEKLTKVNVFHVQLLAHFLEKLRSTPDGDGTLLDHSLIVYGAGLSNSNTHHHHGLPIVVVGGGEGELKRGHVRFPLDTPIANLHVSLLDKLGVRVPSIGDSTGPLEI